MINEVKKYNNMKTRHFPLLFALLAFALVLVSCSKDEKKYSGAVPLTDSLLYSTWTFDSTAMDFVYQTLTFQEDPRTRIKTLTFSAEPEMVYQWILDGSNVEGQAIHPDSYIRQTITLYIKGINHVIEVIPPEEEGEEATIDTTATYMDVNGLVSETHLGYFDTMYSFSGRLWRAEPWLR